eukprot:7385056-Prymnesium_polylepis.1
MPLMHAPRCWHRIHCGIKFIILWVGSCDAGRVCRITDIDRSASGWQVPRGCAALDLSFTVIGPEGAAQLETVLAKRPVRGLNLTWSAVGLEGVPALTR